MARFARIDSQIRANRLILTNRFSEDAMGGWKKRGGWKTSRMTPLPKRGFGPPLVRYVFHPPQVSVLCFFLCKDPRQSRPEALRRGPKIFGRARSLVRFPPPIRFAPPPYHGPSFRVPELNPFFCESRFGGLNIANRRFEAMRANRPHVL